MRRGWLYDEPSETAREVHESDRKTFTGLYDRHGNQLHRHPEPIGFDPSRWEAKKRKGKGRGC